MEITVFEQNGSGRAKIAGIREYGKNITVSRIIGINEQLPIILDEPEKYIPKNFGGDLVLDFLRHPDLSDCLIKICTQKKIPVVASGKKKMDGAFTPFTCCGLGKHDKLGDYGRQFGFPEFDIEVENDIVTTISVVRGAPCGATWKVLDRIVGCSFEKALSSLPREIQYICVADPSNFDPVTEKSPLHYAGHVHRAALEKAKSLDRRNFGAKRIK